MQAEGGPGQGGALVVVAGELGGLPERLAGALGVARAAQRLAQPGQQPCPAGGPELPGLLGQPQRPPVVAGRVLVGEQGRGLLGGQLAVADGAGRRLGRFLRRDLPGLVDGPQVVAGQLGRADVGPAVAQRLQGRGRLQVEPGPGRRVQLVVQNLPEQVVGEAPGAELAGRADHHPGRGGLAEQVEHHARGPAGHPGQDGGPQVGAGHRARLQQPDTGVAEGGQPAPDRVADPMGDGGRLRVGGQQPAHLLDEERVAAGPAVHAGAQLGVAVGAGDPGEQEADLGRVEAAQRQGRGLGLQPGQGGGERVAGRDLDVTVGGDQQLAAAPGPPGVGGGQLDRCRVGPVQVVEDHDQRARPGRFQQGAADGVEALEPGRRRGRPPGPPGVAEPPIHPERGQGLQPGPERRGGLPAGAPGDGGAPGLGVVGGGRGQGGLADPGLAGEGDQAAPGRQGGLDQRLQLGKRLLPADQTGGGRGHGPERSSPRLPGARVSRR